MRVFSFTPDKPIVRYGSTNAMATPVLQDGGGFYLTWIRLEAGGYLGNHPATSNQLFIVVSGAGWVQAEGASRVAISAGQAAFWQAGEWHESGTDTGITALVVEGNALELAHIVGEN